MNHKILITISLIIGSLAMSCINSNQKQQSKTNVIPKNPVEQVFKEISSSNKTLEELLKNEIIKERIIRDYSNNFYDKLLNYMQILGSSIVTYEQGIYKCNAIGMGIYYNHTINCSYSPSYDELNIEFKIDGRKVQSNGELYYNTEGWNFGMDEYKNDFDEIVKREPVAMYKINGAENSFSQNKFAVAIRTYAITLWTNELGSLYEIKSIRIKDNKTGIIYNIDYNEHYRYENRIMNDNIGVYMYGDNAVKFMSIVSRLDDYTISIKGYYEDYEENVIIKNPKNLSNIIEVYKQLEETQRTLNN